MLVTNEKNDLNIIMYYNIMYHYNNMCLCVCACVRVYTECNSKIFYLYRLRFETGYLAKDSGYLTGISEVFISLLDATLNTNNR